MKMKLADRLGLIIGALFSAVVGVGIVIYALQSDGLVFGMAPADTLALDSWLLVLIGALLFLWSVFLLSLPARAHKRQADYVIQQAEGGEMRISVQAMESLVRQCFSDLPEAALDKLSISNLKQGVGVNLDISLAQNVSIPLAVGHLQQRIKQHLLAASGVEVKEIKVSVNTDNSLAKESRYLVRDAKTLPEKENPGIGGEAAEPWTDEHGPMEKPTSAENNAPEDNEAERGQHEGEY